MTDLTYKRAKGLQDNPEITCDNPFTKLMASEAKGFLSLWSLVEKLESELKDYHGELISSAYHRAKTCDTCKALAEVSRARG